MSRKNELEGVQDITKFDIHGRIYRTYAQVIGHAHGPQVHRHQAELPVALFRLIRSICNGADKESLIISSCFRLAKAG